MEPGTLHGMSSKNGFISHVDLGKSPNKMFGKSEDIYGIDAFGSQRID